MVALTKHHTLYEWSAQAAVDPIPVARAKGIHFWTPEDKRFIDFNSQLMCVNAGHGDPRIIKAIQEQAATLAYANPFMATEARARLGEKLAEITPATSTCSSSPTAAPKPTRTPSASPGGHRPPQDPRALPLVSRRHRRQPDDDRRSAPLGDGAGHARRRPRARPVSRHAARLGHRRRGAAQLEEVIELEGPKTHRRLHHRDGQRHQRHPRAARRLPRGRARAVRQARHPADLRRGDVRLRPHRHVVRGRPLEGGAGHHDDGQGPDERLRAARRGRDAPRASPITSSRRSSTAASPTTATRSAAPRRWPRSRSTKRTR